MRTKTPASDGSSPDKVLEEHYQSRTLMEEEEALYCAGEIRILVMDEDPAVGRLMQKTLATHAFHVDFLSDPQRVRSQLRKCSYQVIILDYELAGSSWDEVLEWVHEHQPDACLIVVTAHPSFDSALHCLRAHIFDYLTKPFPVHNLERAVLRCLEDKGLLRLSETDLRRSLGAANRDRRKSLGLTLAQLAQRTGVSLGYLSQIELGKNSASIETLYRISLGLSIRLADMFRTVQPGP